MTSSAGVAAGGDALGFRPSLERSSYVHGVVAIGVLRQLLGLRDPRGVHPWIAVMAVDAPMIGRFLGGCPELTGTQHAFRWGFFGRGWHSSAVIASRISPKILGNHEAGAAGLDVVHDDFDGIEMRIILRADVHAAAETEHLDVVISKRLYP